MPNRNVHEVMGHLGKDPELRATPTGKSVFCRFSVATSYTYGEPLDKDKEEGK